MYLGTFLLLLFLGVIAAFAAVNWETFTAPASLSLVFAVVEAPLGLIMLGLAAILTMLFLVFSVYVQTSAIIEGRRYARELRAQRELTEQAEASRFTELRSLLENELPKLVGQVAELRGDMNTRLDGLDQNLRVAIEQTGKRFAAYVGELEDRLERGMGESDSKSSV